MIYLIFDLNGESIKFILDINLESGQLDNLILDNLIVWSVSESVPFDILIFDILIRIGDRSILIFDIWYFDNLIWFGIRSIWYFDIWYFDPERRPINLIFDIFDKDRLTVNLTVDRFGSRSCNDRFNIDYSRDNFGKVASRVLASWRDSSGV